MVMVCSATMKMTNCALDFIKLSLGVTKKTKGVERMSNMQIHVASESNKY